MQQLPSKIDIVTDNIVEVKFNGMFPKQEYHVVATNLKSEDADNFNLDHASDLQKKLIDNLLGLRHPTLDAVPLIRKVSFNKDSNTWRIEIFSIKVTAFGDLIPSQLKEAFEKSISEEGFKINWGLRF